MTETIIKSAEEECPTVFENDKFQNEIRSKTRKKNNLDAEFVHACVVDQAGTQVMNKIKCVPPKLCDLCSCSTEMCISN